MKLLIIICLVLFGANAPAAETIYSPSGIVIRTCDHDAGAICSLTWGGKQFIDDHDHGRQLQSAVSFDGRGEAENPTEAGASYLNDGFNPHPSSSVLLASDVTFGVLSTVSRPAYWEPLAWKRVSDILFTKRVEIGRILPNVIEYETSFTIPVTEEHRKATFEVLTAYISPEFSVFWTVDVRAGSRHPAPLSDGPGEQPLPVIIATPNGRHAIGIYSPGSPQASYPQAGYGRWRFPDVVKWNNVYRVDNPRGTLRFRSYVAVGTLDQVATQLLQLHNKLSGAARYSAN